MLQLCPRCHIPLAEGRCPRCGDPHGQDEKAPAPDSSSENTQPPIQFDVTVLADSDRPRKEVDWKGELRRRLDERAEKGKETGGAESEEKVSEPDPEPKFKTTFDSELEPDEKNTDTPPTLFKYKLDRALKHSSTTDKIERPSGAKKHSHVFEEPLVRRKPTRPIQHAPGQRILHLKPDVPIARRAEDQIENELIEEEEPRMSKEILFSRFLSGIVDLVLPLLIGFAFTIVASFLLGFDLLSPLSMKWIGLFALSFFLFNSLFFLMTSGQTPGMTVTDLRLVDENGVQEVSQGAILLRVLLFLPSVITVIGLAWALFDPWCRCLHDLLSHTRIEPES